MSSGTSEPLLGPSFAALARADLRRGARWVALLEEAQASGDADAAAQLDPRDFAVNELPLRVELLPFLFVRSGRPLVELLTWAATVKDPDWVAGVLQMLPMAAELYEDLHVPADPQEQRRIHAEVLRRWLRLCPEAADEAVLHPLQHQFERRLSRRLTSAERAVLHQRLATLGADRLGDVVLDMDAAGLAAWLADLSAH